MCICIYFWIVVIDCLLTWSQLNKSPYMDTWQVLWEKCFIVISICVLTEGLLVSDPINSTLCDKRLTVWLPCNGCCIVLTSNKFKSMFWYDDNLIYWYNWMTFLLISTLIWLADESIFDFLYYSRFFFAMSEYRMWFYCFWYNYQIWSKFVHNFCSPRFGSRSCSVDFKDGWLPYVMLFMESSDVPWTLRDTFVHIFGMKAHALTNNTKWYFILTDYV